MFDDAESNGGISSQPESLAEPSRDAAAELKAFNQIVSVLNRFSEKARARVLGSALTFLGWNTRGAADFTPDLRVGPAIFEVKKTGSFSEDRTLSPKEFMLEKRPTTDVERIACLAYYLTHYRETPYFKTLDLSKLNTEAAQIKFSNAAKAVENAAAAGLLVQAGKGKKQISAIGELYVQALPDRDAARAAIAHAKRRKRGRRASAHVEENA
jgi:hypothetical protein